MNKGVSIVLCCYNSSERLQPTLEHLAAQNVANDLNWEVIIADNNSTDNTGEVAKAIWTKTGNPNPIKVVFEARQGISFAREAGISVADYEYILFCDDDNWLVNHYVQTVFDIFEKEKNVVSIGGVGEAVCETSPPKWFVDLDGECYACGQLYDTTGIISKGVVYGAGMAIRKSVFNRLFEAGFHFSLTGRNGDQPMMGEEVELGLMFRILGYDIWYDTSLTFKHFMPKNRLDYTYYKALRYNFGKALSCLYPHYHNLFQKPMKSTFFWLWYLKTLFYNPIFYFKNYLTGNFYKRHEAIRSLVASRWALTWSAKSYFKKRNEILQIKQRYESLKNQ